MSVAIEFTITDVGELRPDAAGTDVGEQRPEDGMHMIRSSSIFSA